MTVSGVAGSLSRVVETPPEFSASLENFRRNSPLSSSGRPERQNPRGRQCRLGSLLRFGTTAGGLAEPPVLGSDLLSLSLRPFPCFPLIPYSSIFTVSSILSVFPGRQQGRLHGRRSLHGRGRLLLGNPLRQLIVQLCNKTLSHRQSGSLISSLSSDRDSGVFRPWTGDNRESFLKRRKLPAPRCRLYPGVFFRPRRFSQIFCRNQPAQCCVYDE